MEGKNYVLCDRKMTFFIVSRMYWDEVLKFSVCQNDQARHINQTLQKLLIIQFALYKYFF